ncbi:MAG: glycosyltransferase family 2 protein [Rhodobacteraceae bacterium]|nr:glycosyltransferase family 2 protein [Paracoccaceae bacterium]
MNQLIVTLSSIPARFGKIGPVLESLTAQSAADRICLYIPRSYRRFPDWDGTLPKVPQGVEIRRSDGDFGPATKVLCAAREFAGQKVDILFCDDDHIYAPGWAQSFVALKPRHPGCVIAQGGWQASAYADSSDMRELQPRAVRRWRLTDLEFQLRYLWQDVRAGARRKALTAPPRRVFKRSGYVDVFEGYAGVLVQPGMFDQAFYDIPPVLWGVDDVWLSGMLTLRGIPIWLQGRLLDPRQAESERHAPLAKSVIDGADRRTANREGVVFFQRAHGLWQ